MAALVCDICGGKLIMGSGSIAICDSCGMEHTKERMQEKVQEIKGVVQIDNSHMIDNYFSMAENAYQSENLAEAENYCNKIIEINPEYGKVWYLKGKTAGWQTSSRNNRINEAVSCFIKAIQYVEDEEHDMLKVEIAEEMKKLVTAILCLSGNQFAKYPDQSNGNRVKDEAAIVYKSVIMLAQNTGIIATAVAEEMATIIYNSTEQAWAMILRAYMDSGVSNSYACKRFLE